jgi:transcription antitermination factor NusG
MPCRPRQLEIEPVNADAVWFVLHVKPRCEKKMADYCAVHAIEHYLPLRQETKIYQRRRVTVQKPVFPGYVFTVFALPQRSDVLKSNTVVRILEVLDQKRLLDELAQIRMALGVDPTLKACSALRRGQRVRIEAGPFQGLEGIVQTLKGKTRVLLNVDMIGQAVAVEVDAELLETAD